MGGEKHLPKEFNHRMHHLLDHLQDKIGDLKQTMDEKDCCILNDFEEVNKLFKSIHHNAATFYLQLYLEAYTKHLEILTACAQALSEKRHGALIAIKRKDAIDTTLVHSGVPLHAKLSASLLEAIFYPGNPLHDGGVLIEEDTIISAGNIFPSAVHFKGKEKVGTRHRAAIGLSEISDALVMVVSEETGRISFALGGTLYPIQPGGISL
ncbi:sporulation-specific diadenylate cyclase CdaS [Niallia circulans]|uniref:Sporulation-specific diadenylate cyclase CdaS n=1 Tax=Niallia circulans TaxID=1397 RepID=A0A941GFT1_NIACI|nr:sporulation-specific diadenylate cyclase CdaS [Niallia circulans]MCB5236074.1 sporulation-specific diadenylate cyclase CdaS [Niallia circulans]